MHFMETVVPVFIAAAFCVAFVVAVAVFLRTPREHRFKLSSREYAQLKRDEEIRSGHVVVIDPQPKRALVELLPWAPVFVSLSAFGLYIKLTPRLECESVGGISSLYLALVAMSYVVPISLMFWAVVSVPRGLKVLREGYFPPLDTASFTRVLARKGVASTVRGYVIVAMPLLLVPAVYFGHSAYEGVMNGRSYAEFAIVVSEKCITIRSSGRP